LRKARHALPSLAGEVPPWDDPLLDEDLHLALYVLYELHYRGFSDVDVDWEWEPSLLELRQKLEAAFEAGLKQALGEPAPVTVVPELMDIALRELVEADDAPSVSMYIETLATVGQLREALIHRAAYQLKEADPHTWAIPRLWGPPKAALIEIQADEYGGGRPERVHAQMYADSISAMGLDASYNTYLNRVPGVTLAPVNLMSLLGLHRRWRGAIVGHLALAEITSALPNGRWANGVRRLGFGSRAAAFFDEHVFADAVHENIAGVDMAGGLVRQDPDLAGDILWGARAYLLLDGRWARYVLSAWAEGRDSLLEDPRSALPQPRSGAGRDRIGDPRSCLER
jgi:hypothetical protein